MKKNENMPVFGSGNWSWLSIIEHFAVAGAEKECNKYDLTAAQYF
jgi:hypothetical protein